MMRMIQISLLNVKAAYVNNLLPMLLLGVVLVTFVLVFTVDDSDIALGVLVLGCGAALYESAAHRNRKR